MKISKAEAFICLLAAMFLSFLAGWFTRGEHTAQPVLIEAERAPAGGGSPIPSPDAAVTVSFTPVPDTTPAVSPAPTPDPVPAASPVPDSSEVSASAGKLDLNAATQEELETLPGIGEKRAADIVADREKNGSFRSVEDLTRVKGIGEGILAKVRDYIIVGAKK